MIDLSDPAKFGLIIVDLQNDFLHPQGAYGRAGCTAPQIAAVPARLASVVAKLRERGGWIISTHFTLFSGKDGEPQIAPHLKVLRPFLAKGDFLVGSWGHRMVDELGTADFQIEKVAYSAFYMTRLEWLLRKFGITSLAVCGIVTNGGVASTVRDAHLRDIPVAVVEDGCAAFSDDLHRATIVSLGSIAEVTTCAGLLALLS
jgi:nicotinamidase-related amidase